jgi:hypothetical protein
MPRPCEALKLQMGHVTFSTDATLPAFLKASRADSASRGLVLGADEHPMSILSRNSFDRRCYVGTNAIREAVKGRELDVLSALGIEWRGVRGHIRCPYEDHGGADDWRWDDKLKLALCTCIGRRPGEPKTHNIFSVVAVKEGTDFESAKLRVAQIIGRTELIRTKFQRTDPDSLLNTAPENRDDSLVWNYLGHRLGIASERVPRPTTQAVGIKSLPYFDPPKTERGNPRHVGDFSCAVFETVDSEGKRHAHRIYVAPGGAGKAELGINADGKVRKTKKSAKAVEDGSTSGRAVIWGNPSNAGTEIIVEGVETAAAAAFALNIGQPCVCSHGYGSDVRYLALPA